MPCAAEIYACDLNDMKRTITYHIWPRDVDFSKKLLLLKEFATKRGFKLDDKLYQQHIIFINEYERAGTSSFDEFLEVIGRKPRFDSFDSETRFSIDKEQKRLFVAIRYSHQNIIVSIDATDDDTVVAAHGFLKETLGLSNPPLPECDGSRPTGLQATAFLGKHFDTNSIESARKLSTFLTLLRFRLVEAEEYRAMPIPDKIKRLIDQQDIYIGLVTGKRDHTWLVAEAAYAHGKGKHVIMIVETDAGFNPSIHGKDYEHISIPPRVVEHSFIKLLQEIRSLGILGL